VYPRGNARSTVNKRPRARATLFGAVNHPPRRLSVQWPGEVKDSGLELVSKPECDGKQVPLLDKPAVAHRFGFETTSSH
jgi:hypothetical protein